MALVTCYDPEGQPHQKEPIDAREACLHNGFTMASPGEPGTAPEPAPTLAELLAARDTLQRRERELDQQALALGEQARANAAEAERQRQVAAEQTTEAKRLVDVAAQLASDMAAFEAAKAAAPAPAGKGKTAAPAA